MRTLTINGVLPATILENTAPWEWAGGVGLLEDPSLVRFVEVDGFAGNFFEARLDPRTGFISIIPSARMDFEWFAANNQSVDLNLNLRFFLTDGTQAMGSQSFAVRLLNVDDTPPEALFFATGGSVRAGVAGAVIGRLGVTDPDTASGFTFQLTEMDGWQFEVVNGTLRLRAGVSASLADGPRREVTVLVSDGRQESAFKLAFDILPGTNLPQEPVNFLTPGDRKGNFTWGGPQSPMPWTAPDAVAGYVPIWEINAITVASGLVRVLREDRTSLLFDKPSMIELASGVVDFRATGEAASLWLIWETLLNRVPTLSEFQEGVWHLTHWATPRFIVEHLLTAGDSGRQFARLDNAQFVRQIYANIVPWDPGADVVNWHALRISQAVITRTDFVLDLMEWRRGLQDFQNEVAGGFYVPRRHVSQLGAVLDVTGGWDLAEYIWPWYSALETGVGSYRLLAQALLNTDAAREKWAGYTDRDFFKIVTREILGVELAEEHVAWWQWAVAVGVFTPGDFIGFLAEAMPLSSPFRDLPQGPMFDAIW